MRLGPQVVVSRVVPSADIDARNMFAGSEWRVGGRSHRITVEVRVIHRGLTSVVEMRCTMPDAIAFSHFHMIHLFRQIDIERGAPDFFIGMRGNSEWSVPVARIFDGVNSRFADARKIELRILIAHPFTPRLDFRVEYFAVLAFAGDAQHSSGLGRIV